MRDSRVNVYIDTVIASLDLDREGRRKVRADLEAGLEPLIAEHGVEEALNRFGTVQEVADAFAEQGYRLRPQGGRARPVLVSVLLGLAVVLVLVPVLVLAVFWPARVKRGPGTGSPYANQETTPQQTSPALTALYPDDAQSAWATSGANVLRTDDSGKTWRNVTPNGAVPGTRSAFAASGSGAWLAVWDDKAQQILIYRTADGGKHWQPSVVPAKSDGGANYPRSIATVGRPGAVTSLWLTVEPEHGMNSAPGALFRSDDGGASWIAVSSTGDGRTDGLPFAGDVAFVSADRGWIVGTSVSTANRRIFRTDDKGVTWSEITLRMPKGLGAGGLDCAMPPRFFDGQSGVLQVTFVPDSALANEFRTITYLTRDGGLTWGSPVVTKGIPWFLDLQTGFQVHAGGFFKTADGGQTWEGVKTNIGSFASATAEVRFITPDNGWALVRYPTIAFAIRTTDGGVTWSRPDEGSK